MKLGLLSDENKDYKFYRSYVNDYTAIFFLTYKEKSYLLDIQEKVLISIADNLVIEPIGKQVLPLKPETTNYQFKIGSFIAEISINNQNNQAILIDGKDINEEK